MTDRPRSILVAVDFGEASGRAVSIGGALAGCCGASLRLLHAGAFEVPPYMASRPHDIDAYGGGSHQQADDFLAEFGRQHTSSRFTTAVDGDAPVDAILRAGGTFDLLVLGTHGRRGLSRWWLGSVAERVLREIAGPLLIVHAGAKAVPSEEVFRRVLVYASAPLKGAAAMHYADMLADCFSGEVVDARYQPLEPALERSAATLLAVSMPVVRSGAWLSNIGEPIVRFCERPIVFVPEFVDR